MNMKESVWLVLMLLYPRCFRCLVVVVVVVVVGGGGGGGGEKHQSPDLSTWIGCILLLQFFSSFLPFLRFHYDWSYEG